MASGIQEVDDGLAFKPGFGLVSFRVVNTAQHLPWLDSPTAIPQRRGQWRVRRPYHAIWPHRYDFDGVVLVTASHLACRVNGSFSAGEADE